MKIQDLNMICYLLKELYQVRRTLLKNISNLNEFQLTYLKVS